MALFADDVLLYLSDPLISLNEVMVELRRYGECSGFRVNLSKSSILPLVCCPELRMLITDQYDFKITSGPIRYLGVQIPTDLSQLFSLKFPPLLKVVKEDMRRWLPLSLSLLGRINVVKMNVLPRLLFLFTTLPILLPEVFFF